MAKRWTKFDRVGLWAALVLGTAWLAIGCSPASLSYLFLPFVEDKIPAKCKLATSEKEVQVAILTNFASLETRPELVPADTELSERLAQQLRKRFADNKEK